MAEREIVFDLLVDHDSNQVDLLDLYESYIEDMNEFELESSKNLTEMINSIELRKNESHFRDFLDSIRLIHDTNDSIAPDDKSKGSSKRVVKKSVDLMNVGDQLLDSQIEMTPTQDTKLTKTATQKKPEPKPAKSMIGGNFDESQLKLNLKQPSMQPQSTVPPQNNYFSNYQTNRNHNPFLMADKMDLMQPAMGGMMTGRMTTPTHHTGNYFAQSLPYDQMNYMTQSGMQHPMSSL